MGLFDTAKWLLRMRRDGEDIFDLPDVPTAQGGPDDDDEDEAGEMSGPEALRAMTRAELQQLRDDNAVLGAENERLSRIKGEFFACIESMERQRDEWKEMYFTHSSEHHVAHQKLGDSISTLGQQLRAAVTQLNIYRKTAGHTAVVEPKCLKQVPTSIPEDFKKRMDDLLAGKKVPDTDGKAERAAIEEANPG